MPNFMNPFKDTDAPSIEPVSPATTFTPRSLEEFLDVLRRTPKDILSDEARTTIAAAMSFDSRSVGEIMLPRDQITFVYEHDFLGPLMLDKLYKSGYSHFPVLSSDGRQIVGIIRIENLTSLEIKTTDRASKYIDKKVYYLRSDYSLRQALAAFIRTNCYFFIVIDKTGTMVGLLTYDMLAKYLLGYKPKDDFAEDSSIAAVMRRQH